MATAAATNGWEQRHPAQAAAELAFRRERRKIRKDWSHKVNGTPETHYRASQVRQGALARLFESGAIDIEQLSASQEIATVHQRIGADVAVRTVSLETRIDGGRKGDGAFFEKLGAVRAEVAYSRWRAALGGTAGPVLEMIAGDVGYTEAARIYHMHNRRAKKLLIDALNLWPRYSSAARDEVDEATLAAAQAAIL